ncbi:MAG: hypothetical protein ABJL67_12885 [Sulfitobacter sp.]
MPLHPEQLPGGQRVADLMIWLGQGVAQKGGATRIGKISLTDCTRETRHAAIQIRKADYDTRIGTNPNM